MPETVTDLDQRLKAWTARLHRAEAESDLDKAVECWKRIDELLDSRATAEIVGSKG